MGLTARECVQLRSASHENNIRQLEAHISVCVVSVRFWRWIQPVDATLLSHSFCWGLNPKALRTLPAIPKSLVFLPQRSPRKTLDVSAYTPSFSFKTRSLNEADLNRYDALA